MKHRIVYSADLHGNEVQYQKLVKYALQVAADAVIIGGDIAPKGNSATASLEELKSKGLPLDNFIAMQHLFFKERLPQLVSPLKEKGIPLFIMMGNDDCMANLPLFEKGEEEGLYQIIHGKRLQLTNDFYLVGYSCVPITPFGIKDWEKFDLSMVPEQLRDAYEARKQANYHYSGYKSTLQGWVQFHFTPEMERKDSIQKDLAKPLFQEKPEQTVYVLHSPPHNTNLDIVGSREHVGSLAERLFIEERQPYLTLHGHIHETVDMSGTFKDQIGRAVCFSPGNHNVGKRLACISFDLYGRERAQRIIL